MERKLQRRKKLQMDVHSTCTSSCRNLGTISWLGPCLIANKKLLGGNFQLVFPAVNGAMYLSNS